MKTKREECLQVIILVDIEYESEFEPFTLFQPRCLLPIANVPLIEYTLEWLALSGVVSDVFLVGHGDKLKSLREYFEVKSKWGRHLQLNSSTSSSYSINNSISTVNASTNSFGIQFILIPSSNATVGDALREVDRASIISGDFVLLRGSADLISNVDLKTVWEGHRAKREANKNIIMTSLFSKLQPFHRSRSKLEHMILVLDRLTNRLLDFEMIDISKIIWKRLAEQQRKILPPKGKTSRLPEILIPVKIFDKVGNLDCRYDLVQCNVEICSPENFDYQDLFDDFIKGILTSEILTHEFYVDIIQSKYLARVSSPYLYDAVSQDILSRWSYPIVPDANLFEGDEYFLRKGSIYLSKTNVMLARSVSLKGHVLIGANSSIGENTIIENSVIGSGCNVAANVILRNCYLFDHVLVKPHVIAEGTIMGHCSVIENETRIQSGVLIGFDVHVGPSITIPTNTKLSCFYPFTNNSTYSRSSLSLYEELDDSTTSISFQSSISHHQHQSKSQNSSKMESRLEITLSQLHLHEQRSESSLRLTRSPSLMSQRFGAKSNTFEWTLLHSKKFKQDQLNHSEDGSESESSDSGLDYSPQSSVHTSPEIAIEWTPDSIKLALSSIGANVHQKEFQRILENDQNFSFSPINTKSKIKKGLGDSESHDETDEEMEEPLMIPRPSEVLTFHDTNSRPKSISSNMGMKLGSPILKSQSLATKQFYAEAADTLKHALLSDASSSLVDNTSLEINALKFSCNVDFADVRAAILPVLVTAVVEPKTGLQTNVTTNYTSKVKQIFDTWSPLLAKFTLTEADQLHLLNLCLDSCLGLSELGTKLFPWMISAFYQNDVVEEDVILKWYRRDADWLQVASAARAIRASIFDFVRWLEEAQDDDDDDHDVQSKQNSSETTSFSSHESETDKE